MLTQLSIQNFKCWKDTSAIRMAPITLFFGANSSGKSSIGQFLMLLKQTAESQDRKAPLFPGGRNSAVQLGSFQEMVFGRDVTNKIVFGYQWTLPNDLQISDPLSNHEYSGNSIKFYATVAQDGSGLNTIVVEKFGTGGAKTRVLGGIPARISSGRHDGRIPRTHPARYRFRGGLNIFQTVTRKFENEAGYPFCGRLREDCSQPTELFHRAVVVCSNSSCGNSGELAWPHFVQNTGPARVTRIGENQGLGDSQT
ncbi:MAG: AAA family ATPase [Pirellulaceae bacterium]